MNYNWKKIDKIFKRREKLHRERFNGITVQSPDIQKIKDIDQELIEESENLTFSYEGKFQEPHIIRCETNRDKGEIEFLNSIIFHFDSFTRETLRKFTRNDRNSFKILETWRRLYCTMVPVNYYYLDGSFDGKRESFGRNKIFNKMLSYNKITTTNREESLRTLKKIIFVEYEKYRDMKEENNPKIILNIWDFKDLKEDLKEIRDQIEIEYAMFPGEFRIELKSKTQFFIESVGDNKFKLNLKKLKEFRKFSEIFSPREFCAPKSFYNEYRSLEVNSTLFFWYQIKRTLYSFLLTMKEWSSIITLFMAITVWLKK